MKFEFRNSPKIRINLFKDRTTVKIIPINDYTPGKSINLGVKHATKDTILILSAHSQIVKCNFDKIKELLNTGAPIDSHCVVWGKQIPIYKGKKITPRYVWSNFKDKTQDGVPRGSLESLFAEIITREISLPRFNFRRHVIQPISMMGSILLSVEKHSLVKRSFWS